MRKVLLVGGPSYVPTMMYGLLASLSLLCLYLSFVGSDIQKVQSFHALDEFMDKLYLEVHMQMMNGEIRSQKSH